MKKGKILALIITIMSTVALAFSSMIIANASEPNVLTSNGATVSSTEYVFDASSVLTVTKNDSESSISNLSALIYYGNNYKKVNYGVNVEVAVGGEAVTGNLGKIDFSIPVDLAVGTAVSVAYVNDNYDVEFLNATVQEAVGTNLLKFSASHLGEFFVLTNEASLIDEAGVFARSVVLKEVVKTLGGAVHSGNYVKYFNVTKAGLQAYESFDNDAKLLFDDDYDDLMRFYKLASKESLNALYNEDDYSATENGLLAVKALKESIESEIDGASNYLMVNQAVESFKTQINGNSFSKKRSTISATGEVNLSVTAYKLVDGNYVEYFDFSDDAILTVSKVKDEIKVKNTKLALLDNTGVIENGGVYKYLKISATEDTIPKQDTYDKLTVSILVEDLELTDGEVIQVAKYIKNQEVELIEVTVINGYAVFNVTEFGDYAIVKAGYALQEKNEFLAFINKYWLVIATGALILIILSFVISRGKKQRERAEKRSYNEYKKAAKKAQRAKKSKK